MPAIRSSGCAIPGFAGLAGFSRRRGWELYLNRLAIVATGGDPGEDPMASRETVDRLLSPLAR